MAKQSLGERTRSVAKQIHELAQAAYAAGWNAANGKWIGELSRDGKPKQIKKPHEDAKRQAEKQRKYARDYYRKNRARVLTRIAEKRFRTRKLDPRARARLGRQADEVAGHISTGNRPLKGEDLRTAEQVIADYKRDHPIDELDEAMSLVERLRN